MQLEPKDDRLQTTPRRSRRITVNTLALFARILIITLINLYAVRFVLGALGEEDYGIFNAVMGVVMTCSYVFPVLAVSIQRFFSHAMGHHEEQRLQEIFSAGCNIIALSLAVIVVLFETIGLYFIHHKLQIPPERLHTALLIFQCAIITFACSYTQIPYTAAVFAHEDMRLYAYISCLDCALKLGLAVLIGLTDSDRLLCYGAGLAAISLCTMMMYAIIARHRYDECHGVRIRTKGIYKELLSFSGWSMYGAFAGIGMLQGNNILINIFYGPAGNAAYGVAYTIYNAFASLTNSVVLPFRPRMIQTYAANEHTYLNQLFSVSNKAILYLLTAIALPILFEMDTIMNLWLGQASPQMVLFGRLIIIYTMLLAMHNPITTLIQASGRIKTYHLAVESITILCVPLTWWLFSMGMPAHSAFVLMIALCMVAHVVRVVCLKHNYNRFSVRSYLTGVVIPGLVVTGLAAAATALLQHTVEAGIGRTLLLMVASPATTLALTYLIGTNRNEKAVIHGLIRKVLKR